MARMHLSRDVISSDYYPTKGNQMKRFKPIAPVFITLFFVLFLASASAFDNKPDAIVNKWKLYSCNDGMCASVEVRLNSDRRLDSTVLQNNRFVAVLPGGRGIRGSKGSFKSTRLSKGEVATGIVFFDTEYLPKLVYYAVW